MSDAPVAASEVWSQLIEERKASAAARGKKYKDNSTSSLERMFSLKAAAMEMQGRIAGLGQDRRRAEYQTAIAPIRYRIVALIALSLALGGCVAGYTLVKAEPVPVIAGAMKVKPSIAWNKVPRSAFNIAKEESWTQNGVMLDSITFMGGLKDGEAIAKQRPKDDRQVPVFRGNMTPQDLVSMIESYYRIRGQINVFEVKSVKPTTFLGQQGIELDFDFVGGDDVKRKGRSVLAVVDEKFYFMALEGTALHYFDAALPEFEAIAASATI